MTRDSKSLALSVEGRIQRHFELQSAEDIVRRSQQLIQYPESQLSEERIAVDGPALMHPRPIEVPLNAYLASALSQLKPVEKELIVHLSDIVHLVCREVNIELYEPRKKTDPVHNPDVSDSDVFKIDREQVLNSDLLIHLCHFASTGSGEELSFAYDSLVPIILIARGDQSVSRMITGIPSLKIEIRYQEPEDLRSALEARLREIKPFLEQRKLAIKDFAENIVGTRIKQLRLDANLSREDLAGRVGLTPVGLETIEESVDTVGNPSLTHLRLIATALKTTVAELVDPNYYETMLAAIQSLVNEEGETVAARFRGMSNKDRRAILRRFLVRLLYFVND